ncbi:MAG: hypothetical protein IJ481_01670 [Alphaproteobacteria bacterium]|nr:hypothetical protein [Alphaproteobacteria bacterium]
MKKNILISVALLSVFSGYVFAETNSQDVNYETKVANIFDEFKTMIKNKASDDEIESFFIKYFDVNAISKNFCGTVSQDVIDSIAKYLIWRLRSEAIQKVSKTKLGKVLATVKKGKSILVNGSLHVEGENSMKLGVWFNKESSKITELDILSIELISGAKAMIKKNGIDDKVLKSKTEAERAKLISDTLNKAIPST